MTDIIEREQQLRNELVVLTAKKHKLFEELQDLELKISNGEAELIELKEIKNGS